MDSTLMCFLCRSTVPVAAAGMYQYDYRAVLVDESVVSGSVCIFSSVYLVFCAKTTKHTWLFFGCLTVSVILCYPCNPWFKMSILFLKDDSRGA
jgi:hypothetical protein